MAGYKPPALGAIPLFSKEASRLLSMSCLEASSCPWANEEVPEATSGGDRERVREGQEDRSCLTCLVSFGSREEQVEHYKLDWHRYNIKRRLRGLEGVDQAHFERLEGDLSSISGSESDSAHSEDELQTTKPDSDRVTLRGKDQNKSPYLHFSSDEGSTHSIYRCIVPSFQSGMESSHDVRQALQALREPQVWIILMRSGGHFAGAVFRGGSVVAHKTFHRYTVRAKRGTAQSVRDGQQGGHQPKSAGASLRRYNEAALMTEMRDLMTSWSTYAEEASCIFIRVPKHSKGVLVGNKGDKAPFLRGDPRLRDLPFPTRRPTFKEVQATHTRLATVYVGVARGGVSPREKGRGSGDTQSRRKEIEGGEVKLEEGELKEMKEDEGKRMDNEDRNVVQFTDSGSPGLTVDIPDANIDAPIASSDAPIASSDTPIASSDVSNACIDVGPNDVPDPGVPDVGMSVQSEERGKSKRKKKNKKKASAPLGPEVPEFVQLLLKACKDGDLDTRDHVTQDSDQVTQDADQVTQNTGDHVTQDSGHRVTELLKDFGLRPIDGARVEGNNGQEALNHLNTLWNGTTVLHMAASMGCSSFIPILLLYGADPAIQNQSGHTPYSVSVTKEVRDSFRRFMSHHPAAYNYERSHIPSPLTEEMERERSRREAEKKREKKKVKRQREKERQCEQTQQQVVATLSDREKRAMAAEKRMAVQLPSSTVITRLGACSGCGQSLVGVVPFERLDFKYCSMECLRQHRKQLTQ